ncbi:ABC transporter permease [Halocalculus aciditolerans]|uniref:Glutathione ABC transporter permease n=1 Tax=Halocalculus aciditolerans TaxID=1383812 RepID=A0A830FG14_9EURY|nr:ABC transporter permease [Halocalculus aciditolerans]GGL51450.1 glutathione ABC transporter permease [Halocalculus aciditolerans]
MSFARFLTKRVLQGILVVWGVITVVFLLRYVTPGDPVTFIAPLDASPELRQQIAAELGLNRPVYVQYFDYLTDVMMGNLGSSYITGTSANARIFARLPVTVELALASTVVAVVLSIPLGVVSATRRHQPADYAATTFSLVGISTPNFWLGIMLVLVLSVQFGLFPTSGMARYQGDPLLFVDAVRLFATQGAIQPFVTWLSHITLPAITLGTYFTALVTRLTRSGMLDELGKSYIQALRAKGLPETLTRYRHALKNTLIPIITVLGLQLGTLIGGAVITEAVFDWPGLGTLVIDSINARDWVMIQGCLIVIGVSFVLVNIVVDTLYAYVNPQVVYD